MIEQDIMELYINKIRISFFLFGFIFLLPVSSISKPAQNEHIVAKGKDIKITVQDIIDVKNYFKKRGIHPASKKELVKTTTRIKLFSHEAKKLNLVESDSLSIEKRIQVSEKYFKYVLENYKLDKKYIISYYRSYPEKFKVKEKNGTEKVLPLNDVLEKKIKFKIVSAIKSTIKNKEYKELIDKYKIEFVKN